MKTPLLQPAACSQQLLFSRLTAQSSQLSPQGSQLIQRVFLILRDILHRPGDLFYEGVLAYGAVTFVADGTGGFETAIGVNEELDRAAKTIAYQSGEFVDFKMGFVHVYIPWHREVTIHV